MSSLERVRPLAHEGASRGRWRKREWDENEAESWQVDRTARRAADPLGDSASQ
jgi:hypothetical protein